MAEPQDDKQDRPRRDQPRADEQGDARDDEATRRARHGQSLARGDTGSGSSGVGRDRQGISNRPGDAGDVSEDESRDQQPKQDYPGDIPSDAAPADRTTL